MRLRVGYGEDSEVSGRSRDRASLRTIHAAPRRFGEGGVKTARSCTLLCLHTPPLALCTDNGAMIAHAGALRLGDAIAAPTAMHARARWPLDTLAPPAGLTKPKHSTEHPWT